MIRRELSPASRTAVLAVLAVFCAAAVFAQPTVEQLLGKMPGQSTQDMATASQELVHLGPDAVKNVCAMLVPPGGGDDVNARFLLSGLAKHVSRGDAEEARAMVSGAFLQAIEAAEEPEVKAFLIRQVQVCGGAEAVDALGKYLSDERLVEPAAQALLAIRTENVVSAFKAAFEGAEGPRAVTLIKALGELRVADMADKIVPFTASDNRETRLVAYQALAEIGVPQALEPLRKAYETGAPYEKAKAISYGLTYAKHLAEADDMETATAILDALMADEQPNVRSAALSTLVAIGSPSAQNLLLAAMDDPSLEYRAAALQLTSEFPSEETTRQWMAKMDQVSPEVQAEIIIMLGNRGDKVASDTLTRQILSEEKVVRMAAIDAATKLTGSRAVAPMLERLRKGAEEDEIEAIKSALLRAPGRQVVKACAQALDKTPPEARIALLGVLKQRHAEIARREVFAQTKAEDEAVRLAAIDALSTVAKPGDVSRVVDLVVEAPSEAEKAAARTVLVTLAGEKPRRLLNAIEKHNGQAKADLLAALPAIGG
ncbi:MAG: HEAT repeat domain-containing protein, partial [Candidatus Hydrogenedentes bacterium]|nr:HEAT repeat domain-containing protein [Candidatus Hydrogenedentota bacterium]